MKVGDPIPANALACLQIPLTVCQRADLSPAAKLLYAALCGHCNKEGYAEVGQEELAGDIGASLKTTQTAIRSLVKVRLIEVRPPTDGRRLEHGYNQYFFLWFERGGQ